MSHCRDDPPAPLRALRVVDTTDGRAEMCGRHLVDLGAEVVRVEPFLEIEHELYGLSRVLRTVLGTPPPGVRSASGALWAWLGELLITALFAGKRAIAMEGSGAGFPTRGNPFALRERPHDLRFHR